MKTFCLTAAVLLMASTAAHAGNGISFRIDGQKIHIEAPKNCDSLSCLQITAPGLSNSSFNLKNLNFNGLNTGKDEDDDAVAASPAPQSAPAPAMPAAAPPAAVANAAPAPAASVSPAPVPHDAPSIAPVAATTVAAPTPAPQAAPIQTAPAPVAAPAHVAAPAPTTPIGIWATENNKGNVRIEPCGQNLCGYAANSGERILINMKPEDSRWSGRIHDPDSGRNYDSTMAMKGPNLLKVRGCAFGGLFCGGQTWKRVS